MVMTASSNNGRFDPVNTKLIGPGSGWTLPPQTMGMGPGGAMGVGPGGAMGVGPVRGGGEAKDFHGAKDRTGQSCRPIPVSLIVSVPPWRPPVPRRGGVRRR